MAQPTVGFQRQQSLGDLEQLLTKERPFEGSKKKCRRTSDPDIDEIDSILYKDLKSPPNIEKKQQNFIPHLLALARVKSFLRSFLREKAKTISGNYATRETFLIRKIAIDFHVEKMRLLNQLAIQSFIYELDMKNVNDRLQTEKEKVLELSELSNYIVSAQLVIEEFQSVLTKSHERTEGTTTEIAQFHSKLATIEERVHQTKLKAKFETKEGDLDQFFSVPSRICFALGLDVDFLQRFDFERFPDDIQNHRSIEDWICNFLHENYKENVLDKELISSNDKEVLEAIGFRPNSFAFRNILARKKHLQAHLELIDCAILFIKDEFKYNTVLSEMLCPRFYNTLPETNKWFCHLVTQSGKGETQQVCLMNLEQPAALKTKLSELPSVAPRTKLLFHGTDHESVLNILNQGIDIHVGQQKRDFSDGSGFYLTNDLEHSVSLAFGKTSKPAVLVYQVPPEMLTTFHKLSLCGEEYETEWEALVSQFRSGRPSRKLRKSLEKFDFIEGPRSSSYKLPPVAKKHSYQICVISEGLSEKLDGCIRAAVFFDGSNTDDF